MTQLDKQTNTVPFSATLTSSGIVEIYWNVELLEITKEHLISVRSELKKLGNGIKLPLYFYSSEFNTISSEAREYLAKEESSEYTLANAIKIDTLAKKIIFNFILRFFHPTVPTRAFSNKEDAIDWLITLKKEYDQSK